VAAAVLIMTVACTLLFITPGPLSIRALWQEYVPDVPELLPPVAENGAGPAYAQVAPSEDSALPLDRPFPTRLDQIPDADMPRSALKAPPDLDSPRLTAPVAAPPELDNPKVKVALILRLQELEQEENRKKLLQELQQRPAHRIDLDCQEALPALVRMEAALWAQGIRPLRDQEAQERIRLHFKANFALYFDNVTPDETLDILRRLTPEERPDKKKRPTAGFGSVAVNELTRDDHQTLIRLLGTDPTVTQASGPSKISMTPDFRKPLALGTEGEVVKGLKSPARPAPGKPDLKPSDRAALTVTYELNRVRPLSADLKHYLDTHRERRSGTLQTLVILHAR
jgi:hypothetical protein